MSAFNINIYAKNINIYGDCALQLQQEEYSRESLMPNRYRYLPFQVEPDDESGDANPPLFFEPDTPRFTSDEQFAAYLQGLPIAATLFLLTPAQFTLQEHNPLSQPHGKTPLGRT